MAPFNNTNQALIYFTDVNLATLESLVLRKSSSKSDIRRQTSICLSMLDSLSLIRPGLDVAISDFCPSRIRQIRGYLQDTGSLEKALEAFCVHSRKVVRP